MLIVFLTSFGRCWAGHSTCSHHHDVFHPQTEQQEESALSSGFHGAEHHVGHHYHFFPERDHELDEIPFPCNQVPCGVCELNRSGFLTAGSIVELSASPVFPMTRMLRDWENEKLGKICADPDEELPALHRSDQFDFVFTIDLVTSTTVSVRGPNVR